MSDKKRSPALQGIEARTDAKGRKRYRGTANDKRVGKPLRGPWTSSLAQARAWRVDALARLQNGTLSAATAPTVAEAAEAFINDLKSGRYRLRSGHEYKPRQVSEYTRQLRRDVVPQFGPKRVNRLERSEIQLWADELSARGLKPATVRTYVSALRALIAFSELRGWVQVDPCGGLRLPTGETPRDRIASPEEAATLISAMREDDRALLGLAVYAGLRLGESLALEVDDIDFESDLIDVHRSWDTQNKVFVPTKSRKTRKVPIVEPLKRLLQDHLVLLNQPSGGLLFPSAKDPERPMNAETPRRRSRKRWEEAGLTPLGFHEGRHTFASIGIAAGLNPKTLSTCMGHATITITFDRYGHLMPGSEAEARGMLDDYLAR